MEPIAKPRFKSTQKKLEAVLDHAEQHYNEDASGAFFDRFTGEELMQQLYIEEQRKAAPPRAPKEEDDDLATDFAFEKVRKKNDVYKGMPAMIIEDGTIMDHHGTPFVSVHSGYSKEFSGLMPERLVALDSLSDEELLGLHDPFHFYSKLPEIASKNANHPVFNLDQALNELQSYRKLNRRMLMVPKSHMMWHEKIIQHTLAFHGKEVRAKNRVFFLYVLHLTIGVQCVFKIHKPLIEGQPDLYQWMGYFYTRMVKKDQ